jgi:Zn-dependent metalloprotease
MKRLLIILLAYLCCNSVYAQILRGNEAMLAVPGSEVVRIDDHAILPLHVVYAVNQRPSFQQPEKFLKEQFRLPSSAGLEILSMEEDQKGMKHYRYRATYEGIPVIGSMIIFHTEIGKIHSFNGFIPKYVPAAKPKPSIIRDQALNIALNHIGATTYKWQLPSEEAFLKAEQRNPNVSFYPEGRLVYAPKTIEGNPNEYSLAWEFDIYAHEPMSRRQIYVDAQTGSVIHENDLIHHADAAGTAVTAYVGIKPITTDFTGSTYRLREAGRGLGIETYNLQKGTNYAAAVDFTDADNYWNNVNANLDQYACDAHYGAEMTYDYFYTTYGRNSINNAGFKLISYVHYSTNYVNAFWDGSRMTYGDGNATYTPLTSLDICGHEITHGLTSFTANLNYSYQSGALNESFSDIFGTVIEFYAHPPTADWLIGEDIGAAFRSMSNPNAYSQPDTYLGTYWYTGSGDNGGVHYNSGVQNYWFYLLTMGGSGTNDIGNAFNVTGIGMSKAAAIAYRTLTVYLTPTSQYADARYYSIQAAQDLYGPCSPEVIATTNAWYAVGVGAAFSSTVVANFSASATSSCNAPFTVTFTNTSTNANAAQWDFGDGGTSTQYNPTHTYNLPGTYSVTLTASSACGTGTITKTNYITLNSPAPPQAADVVSCSPASVTLNASGQGTLYWFSQPSGGPPLGTGNSFVTPVLSNTTTYYVESRIAQPNQFVGPSTYNFGQGGFHNSTTAQYLTFTVQQPCTLVSVLVNSGAAGTRNIILWSAQGTVLQTIPVNFASGVQTITLNLALNPGSYRLGGSSMNLYRNTSGASYPYTISNLISITGASAGSSYYYYFYNWVIQPPACVSSRTAVNAIISNSSASFASLPDVCAGASPFPLTGGSPSGGTYSGTGVSNNNFDPSVGAGSYTLTYTITDSYGCVRTANSVQNVNALPNVSAGSYNPVCINGSPVQLSGTPAGGTFSGTGVSGNSFDPSIGAGQYIINYSYTDANGCSNSNSATITVNNLPIVNAGNYSPVCNTASPILLSGTPAGGTFSGTGVSGNQFDPSVGPGTYTLTYNYTDANGCSNSSTASITVNDCSCNPPDQPGSISQSGTSSKVCPGEIRTYSVPAVSGVTYQWTVPTGATILSGQGFNSIVLLFDSQLPSSSTLSVQAVNSCGISPERTRTISKNIPSTPSVITGPSAGVCNSQQSYSVTNVAGVTYNWWFDNSAGASIISGQGTNSITAAYLNNFTSSKLNVTANNQCGSSNTRSLMIKGAPAIPPPVTGPTGVCLNQQGVPYSSGPVSGALDYLWTVPSGARINDGNTTSASNTLITTATAVTVNWKTTAGNVRINARNACGTGSASSLAVTFVCREPMTGNNQGFEVGVNPNPVNDFIRLQFMTENESDASLMLTDVSGRILFQTALPLQSGNSDYTLDAESLSSGIYFLTATQNGITRTLKIVKQ